ncbi:uncharacterized protein LOC108666745 [Hyalella azteca]|uniref:Uncharacterized protein LOC108666745 n=1 Tax=Hyalella azteca TaxID=294128 RepID=A0A8B7N6B3_HYAAZ|nr:uncharacterized protein LOC108666745 [Hyalella azteca]
MTMEKKLCGVIMICQMTAILSGVAMLYLAVIVIIPSKDELLMGISIAPIMCSTVQTENNNLKTNPDGTPKKCDWASCREWCLSKDPAVCLQIYVRPRLRGSNVTLEECEPEQMDKACSALNVSAAVPFRCRTGECQDLDGVYNCSKPDPNECRLMSPAYECRARNISRLPIVCNEEKCQTRLIGVVSCTAGECLRLYDVPHYDYCERKCSNLEIDNINSMIFSKERIITRKCKKVTASNGTDVIQNLGKNPSWQSASEVLMLFCTYITPTENGYLMDDCFNATLGEMRRIRDMRDFRDLIKYHIATGETRGWLIDPEEALQVVNDTKLRINSEACTNTLSKKCTHFFKNHRHDERDGRTRDRFPCFYTKSHNDFVMAVFNPEETKMYLLLATCVPAFLFILSCGFLYLCSKLVNPDDDGHLVLKTLKKDPMPSDASDL